MVKIFDKISPAPFFVIVAIILGGIYFCLRPPLQSPDEFNHFLRAYQISEGKFLPEKKDQRLGGEVPACFGEFLALYMPNMFIPNYKITSKEWASGFEIAFSDKERVFKDFPNTSNYIPLSYLPQATTLFVMRQFDCSVGLMYHVTRLVTFFFWVIAMFYVIKTLPGYKWLFVLLLLLPMSLYLSVSITADTITNVLSFMLMALVFKYSLQASPLKKRQLLFLTLICVFLALSKIIYAALLLLLVLLPVRLFKSKLQKYLILGAIMFVSLFTTYAWMGEITKYMISYEDYNPNFKFHANLLEGVDYAKQKEHLLANPGHLPLVIYNTTVKTAQFYLSSYVGRFGAYSDTPLLFWLFVLTYVFIFIIIVGERDKLKFTVSEKLIILITALGTFLLVIISQHLIWNKVGRDIADSIQGRYLVPILPLIFILFNVSWNKIKFNVSPLILLFVFFCNIKALRLIYKRYYLETYANRVDFSCGAEGINKDEFFKTSDGTVFLGGGEMQTSTVKRTGNYSIMLKPDSSISAIFKFKNLNRGDLVELYAWQKGNQGELVMRGKGNNNQPFYYSNNEIQVNEKERWKKMQMIVSAPFDCDSSEVLFYVQNPSKDTIYFDDLRYSIKKFE